jgi:signal transduction histidine kinase
MVTKQLSSSLDETYEQFDPDWLISHLRWLWLVSVFLFAWLKPAGPPISPTVLMVLIGAGAVHNLFQVAALYMRWYPAWLPILGVSLDTLLAISLMAITGGWKSPLLPAVLFPVLVASLRLGLEGGLSSAVVIAFAYASFAIADPEFNNIERLYQVGVNVLLLVGVAFIIGVVFRQQHKSLARAESRELRALRRASDRAKAMYEMASTLSATLNYKRVLTTMLDMSQLALADGVGVRVPHAWSDTSLIGLILLFEEEGNFERLKVEAGRNLPRADEKRVVSGQSGLIAQAIYTAEPAITTAVVDDPVLSQFVCLQSTKTAIAAPLRAGFDSFGVVVFASPQADYFTVEHAEVLSTFCNQAVIALKNAQLYQELEAEQLRILAKESEARHKLARDLHDGPTQTISAIAMRLNFIRMMLKKRQDLNKIEDEVAKVEELARKTTHEVRTMLFTLRPVVLETQGLPAALSQYADRLILNENGPMVEVDSGNYEGDLSRQAESVVFAVVEEAVGNAVKHAHASQIGVRLRVDDHLFSAEIKDDGIGFNVAEAQRRREAGHLGLLNLQERAELIGGRCTIQSRPGAGTLIRLDIPLQGWNSSE